MQRTLDSSMDVNLRPEGVDIDTTDNESPGIAGLHEGTGDINIDLRYDLVQEDEGGDYTIIYSAISTSGNATPGVYGRHTGAGDIDIDVKFTDITTTNASSDGIEAFIGHSTIETDDPPLAMGNIDIDVGGLVTIETEGGGSDGVSARHSGGEGWIDIDVRNSKITMRGSDSFSANGVNVWRTGTNTGDVNVTVTDTDITTEGRSSHGIFVDHQGDDTANIFINVDGSGGNRTFRTSGYNAYGVRGYRNVGTDGFGTGNVTIDVRDLRIITTGDRGRGIDAYHTGTGDIDVDVAGGSIGTSGELAYGIHARHQPLAKDADDNFILRAGDITINVEDLAITTRGVAADGIQGIHENDGDLIIEPRDVTIRTRSTGIYREVGTLSKGIYGVHTGMGDVTIAPRGGSITTRGTYSYGIEGRHTGDGSVAISTGYGHTITTTGDNGHGIVAYHFGTEDSRTMTIAVGGRIDVSGADAHGVLVGTLSSGDPIRVTEIGADGFRQQSVTVNGSVYGGSGSAAGIFLAGGGKVYIGPQGTVGADSGIAIRASGGEPKLYLDMNLDGRRVAEVIGDDWIINDDGETTIVVNSVMLHDGATGSTGMRAANGAWDVMVIDEGVTVDTSTSPWTISTRATGIIADRDFFAGDFEESMTDPPPPPPPEPEPEPEPEAPSFMEMYAPRAAVYEALPGFMLRLTGLVPSRGRANSLGLESLTPRSSVWMRFSGATETYGAESSTVGAGYDFDRRRLEAGLNAAFGENVDGWVSMRHVTGSADVSSPTGGGRIAAEGLGPAAGIALGSTDGFYASGGFSLMFYDMDLSSDTQGLLKADTKGYVQTLDFQAGRGIGLGGNTTIVPLGRVTHSRVAVDDFTDAVDARVSFPDLHRVAGGLGMALETSHGWNDGAFFLRGSMEIERTFRGAATVAHVSGETLTSEAARDCWAGSSRRQEWVLATGNIQATSPSESPSRAWTHP